MTTRASECHPTTHEPTVVELSIARPMMRAVAQALGVIALATLAAMTHRWLLVCVAHHAAAPWAQVVALADRWWGVASQGAMGSGWRALAWLSDVSSLPDSVLLFCGLGSCLYGTSHEVSRINYQSNIERLQPERPSREARQLEHVARCMSTVMAAHDQLVQTREEAP